MVCRAGETLVQAMGDVQRYANGSTNNIVLVLLQILSFVSPHNENIVDNGVGLGQTQEGWDS